jgi:hypothetical protein
MSDSISKMRSLLDDLERETNNASVATDRVTVSGLEVAGHHP